MVFLLSLQIHEFQSMLEGIKEKISACVHLRLWTTS